MFGIGGFELFLIVLFAFLLFGPEKIPVFINTLRKAVTKFREAEQEVTSALKQEVVNPETGETAADVIDSFKGNPSKSTTRSTTSSESFAQRKARHERERAQREERKQASHTPTEQVQTGQGRPNANQTTRSQANQSQQAADGVQTSSTQTHQTQVPADESAASAAFVGVGATGAVTVTPNANDAVAAKPQEQQKPEQNTAQDVPNESAASFGEVSIEELYAPQPVRKKVVSDTQSAVKKVQVTRGDEVREV